MQGCSPLHIAACEKQHIQDWMNQDNVAVAEIHECYYHEMESCARGETLTWSQYQVMHSCAAFQGLAMLDALMQVLMSRQT